MNDCCSSDGPKCPYCGNVHSECEDLQNVCTYWGSEDGPVEYWCSSCELSFDVKEIVSRSWESEPKIQKSALSD